MDVTFSPALRVYAKMWEIAGRRREADAQFAQALAHIRSGTPDAMAKAFDLFKRSGAHNFTEAQFAAGWCCEHGCGTKRNYPQATRLRLYFECESYAAAVDALLDAQEREDSFMADYEAAVGGDATGMLYLGHRYYYGQDVACDQAEGIRWYHRAAEAGSDAAMSRLAGIYEADKHYKEAARWYRRYAAERIRWRNQRLNW